MAEYFIKLDGINWWINNQRSVVPLCPKHKIRLQWTRIYKEELDNIKTLRCEECKDLFSVPRGYSREIDYVLNKIDSSVFKQYKYINLDDESIPIAEDKNSSEDGKFFVTARLMKSKIGLRLVVYAGERGKSNKTQIFIEPEIKRLAFDQNDLHPIEVFTKLEATFGDNSRAMLSTSKDVVRTRKNDKRKNI